MAVKPELVAVQDEDDPARRIPDLKEYRRDFEWLLQHVDELTDQYPDQWVAVVDGEVVAAGKDGGAVSREARAKTGRYNFPMDLMQTGSWPSRIPR